MDGQQHAPVDPDQGRPSSASIRKMMVGGMVLGAVCGLGVLGYLLAGWRLDDAIYMVVITIFGVGYGEVQPIESWPLRTLTTVVIVAGYGAVIYTIGGFIQLVVDGELNSALGARRMTREIDKLDEHVIICGLGRMGIRLAAELHDKAKPFAAIDLDPAVVAHAESLGYLAMVGDASDESVLTRAGVSRAAMLAAVLSDDAANVFVTLTAHSMQPELPIVARGENERTETKLLSCGADRVVLPTAIGAAKMSQMILRPTADELFDQLGRNQLGSNELGHTAAAGFDLVNFGLEFEQVEITPDSPLADHALGELEVKGAHGYLVFGVRHADGTTVLHPPAETKLHAGDTIVILGYEDDVLEVGTKQPSGRRSITYRGAQTFID